MIVTGRLHSLDQTERIITIKHKKAIKHYYIQRSIFNEMEKYLTPNRFLQFVIFDETRVKNKKRIATIDYFIRIESLRARKNIVYYDIKRLNHETRDLINNLNYKCFLDLEMSMHPYYVDKDFVQEVIQVGYVLVDKHDNIIDTYNQMIQPTRHKKITKRTKKFLKIDQEDVDNGIPFESFYENFSKMIKELNPAIFVWGKNDHLALSEGYKVNELPSLQPFTRYINLLQLHKNFFHLKNDLGLFNALNLYQNVKDKQKHDALDDALATYEIYKGFKKVLNGKLRVKI